MLTDDQYNDLQRAVHARLDSLRDRIGRNLHDIRRRRKISLDALSRLTGFAPRTIDRLELGDKRFDLDHLARIALALKITERDLMEERSARKIDKI